MNNLKKIAAVIAACMALTACGSNKAPQETAAQTTAARPDYSTAPVTEDEELDTETLYTGREVENEADRAIYKLTCTPPEGFDVLHDDGEGKQFISKDGSIIIKAQNFRDEFGELETFADQGCVSIKMNNMLKQADTDFSEPVKTKVAGFDAIRYDYTVKAYMFPPVTDAEGGYVTGEDGNYVLEKEKELIGEFADRVYYFFSDEDVFYVLCETTKDNYSRVSAVFDSFIDSISVA